ncbi:VOC family protein [Alkalihalobacillus sp. AL-G]|uniref:VOC family protein n=1 Tax=Alkalihalobacillus sp. AL-G TaxID=2926399 RepID=UPI00272A3AD7|nr:VOC family protein [Alkalihalobacillus sp. AL-G]WLD94979.1 VOC family protein [Alkalihalobacillus sp. AL-G]
MKITVTRLHHVQVCIPTGKEDEARRFYTGILGFKEIDKPEALKANGGLWYRVGDIELHIGTEPFTEHSKRHPAFEVENIDQIKKYLKRHSVKIKNEIQIPGMNRFSFFDPFTNRIEFLELDR